jgi:hypothetical protein
MRRMWSLPVRLYPRYPGKRPAPSMGREALSAYFRKGLQAYPDLHFELIRTLIGVDSLLLYYRSVKGLLAAEMMIINGEGQIQTVRVHYVKE